MRCEECAPIDPRSGLCVLCEEETEGAREREAGSDDEAWGLD